MAGQNHFMALLLLCLSLLLCINGKANGSAISKQDAAQDAITLAKAEAEHIKGFFTFIPQLNSLRNVQGEAGNELSQCVGGLVHGINNILMDLNNLERNFDSTSLYKDSRSLGDMLNDPKSFRHLCHHALKHVDTTIYLLIRRKLEDIVLLTNDVRLRVHQLQGDGGAAGKNLNQHA